MSVPYARFPFTACTVAAALVLTMACATNPATGKKEFSLMSEAQEIQLGQQMDGEVKREMGVYDHPELQRYVSEIGMRLARASERPNLPWRFTVVDEPAVNAFALPGGADLRDARDSRIPARRRTACRRARTRDRARRRATLGAAIHQSDLRWHRPDVTEYFCARDAASPGRSRVRPGRALSEARS